MARKERIKCLQEKIKEHGLGGALLFYSRDVFYYTGTAQPSYLVVLPEDYFLYVRSGFEFAANDVFIEKDKMKEERRLENIFQEISSRLMGKKIGTELDVLPAKQFLEFKEKLETHEMGSEMVRKFIEDRLRLLASEYSEKSMCKIFL